VRHEAAGPAQVQKFVVKEAVVDCADKIPFLGGRFPDAECPKDDLLKPRFPLAVEWEPALDRTDQVGNIAFRSVVQQAVEADAQTQPAGLGFPLTVEE
jgi:hypothetical protein